VQCYEGKVMVIQEKDTTYLTKGNAYQNSNKHIENWNFSEKKPAWQDGETSFKSAPLDIVIASLEKQFEIEIQLKNIDTKKLFTGSFSNTDLETALKSVCIPMQINYHIENKKVFLSKK
jgi:ferric-dicitrate binding protein FerR (iron transport regulator)